jgi:hypothetical protein
LVVLEQDGIFIRHEKAHDRHWFLEEIVAEWRGAAHRTPELFMQISDQLFTGPGDLLG